MHRLAMILSLCCLNACSGPVIDTRDVVISKQPNHLEFGHNCASIDVTETKISTY